MRNSTYTVCPFTRPCDVPGWCDGGSDLEEGAGPEAIEVVAPSAAAAVAVRAPAAAAGVVAETDVA